MLTEQKIQILNRLRANSLKTYREALKKFGISESDVPERPVSKNTRTIKEEDKRQTYFLGGKPYFGIPPVKTATERNTPLPDRKEKAPLPTGKEKIRSSPKRIALFIDGENISSRKAKVIFKNVRQRGDLVSAKVYGLQKDASTLNWKTVAGEIKLLQDIRLSGGPEENKVDKKIQKDARQLIKNDNNIDIICFATSDAGFTETIKLIQQQGKNVILICENKAPDKLKNAADKCVIIR